MRRVLIATALIAGLAGCEIIEEQEIGPNVSDIETNLSRIYEDEQAYRDGKDWDTLQDVHKTLHEKQNPKLMLVTSDSCAKCMMLHREIRKQGLREQVRILNINEGWVHKLVLDRNLKGAPVLVLVWNGEKEVTRAVYNPPKIMRKIKYWVGKKNP